MFASGMWDETVPALPDLMTWAESEAQKAASISLAVFPNQLKVR